jgi:hypothetical protein
MPVSAEWINGDVPIPKLLIAAPQVRPVLDRYGLKGCGGATGPAESLAFFARAHDVPLNRLLAELRLVLSMPPPHLVSQGPDLNRALEHRVVAVPRHEVDTAHERAVLGRATVIVP